MFTRDFDTSFDCDFSDSITQTDLKAIVRTADIFDVIHPENPAADNRDIKSARYHLKEYILRHSDKPHAFWEVFKAVYQDHTGNSGVSMDAWTQQVYYKGKPTTPERLLSKLEDTLGISTKLSWDAFERKLGVWLDDIKFNPVNRYLTKCCYQHYEQPLPDWWDTLAAKLFGTSDELSQQMLVRWLIGAVARAMNPGCQMDTALVIRGSQGIGKTSFLRALFGKHFVTLHSHQKDEEQKRMLGGAWGIELGELESITRAKDVEALKAFLTETDDIYRELYAKTPESHPRHCVFAGTANSTELLRDNTGSRRFWILDAGDFQIPVDWVVENRDLLWSTAYRLWKQGHPYWLDQVELRQQSEERNSSYQTQSEFTEPLEPILAMLERKFGESFAVRASDLLQAALGIPPERQLAGTIGKKLKQAMKELSYESKQIGKDRTRVYCKPGMQKPEIATITTIEEAKHRAASEKVEKIED